MSFKSQIHHITISYGCNVRNLQENKVPGKEQRVQPAALFFRYLFLAADPLALQDSIYESSR